MTDGEQEEQEQASQGGAAKGRSHALRWSSAGARSAQPAK